MLHHFVIFSHLSFTSHPSSVHCFLMDKRARSDSGENPESMLKMRLEHATPLYFRCVFSLLVPRDLVSSRNNAHLSDEKSVTDEK